MNARLHHLHHLHRLGGHGAPRDPSSTLGRSSSDGPESCSHTLRWATQGRSRCCALSLAAGLALASLAPLAAPGEAQGGAARPTERFDDAREQTFEAILRAQMQVTAIVGGLLARDPELRRLLSAYESALEQEQLRLQPESRSLSEQLAALGERYTSRVGSDEATSMDSAAASLRELRRLEAVLEEGRRLARRQPEPARLAREFGATLRQHFGDSRPGRPDGPDGSADSDGSGGLGELAPAVATLLSHDEALIDFALGIGGRARVASASRSAP